MFFVILHKHFNMFKHLIIGNTSYISKMYHVSAYLFDQWQESLGETDDQNLNLSYLQKFRLFTT